MTMTRAGATAIPAGIVLGGAGLTLGYPELVTLGVACFCGLVIGVLWTAIRPTLDIRPRFSKMRVGEGEPTVLEVDVTNHGRFHAAPVMATTIVGSEPVPFYLPWIGSGGSTSVREEIPARPRGRYPVSALLISRSDPFGLMRWQARHGSPSVLWVHPKQHPMASLPVLGSPESDDVRTESSTPGGVAFYGLREYQTGDDWRLIHWASTARLGKLIVRQDVVGDETHQLVLLDTAADSYSCEEAFDDAVRVAGSWCLAGARRGLPVEVRTTGGRSASINGGDRNGIPLLDVLTEAHRSTGPSLAETAGRVNVDGATVAGVVTGDVTARRLTSLTALRRRVASLSVICVGPGATAFGVEIPGLMTITGRTSVEAVTRWNASVRW